MGALGVLGCGENITSIQCLMDERAFHDPDDAENLRFFLLDSRSLFALVMLESRQAKKYCCDTSAVAFS
jgi:hypothetical protein